MARLSRAQILVYGATAVALLLVGARWIRSADASGPPPGGVRSVSASPDAVSGEAGLRLGGAEEVVVHVAGAVQDPGVYRLPAGARVTDAVRRAGGPGRRASLDSLNLAAALTDGQQVVVPGVLPAGGAPTAGASAGAGGTSVPISLGSATVEQLDTIDGIGPVTAQSIVDFRAENGGISSVEDLDQISGIGPATMEALRAGLQP